jgi:hypothetical protein
MTTDAERLASLRKQRDIAPIRYDNGVALAPMQNFQWIEVDFLFDQLDKRDAEIATLRLERDEAQKALTEHHTETVRVIGDLRLREHVSYPDCWCGPEEDEPGVWIHRDQPLGLDEIKSLLDRLIGE